MRTSGSTCSMWSQDTCRPLTGSSEVRQWQRGPGGRYHRLGFHCTRSCVPACGAQVAWSCSPARVSRLRAAYRRSATPRPDCGRTSTVVSLLTKLDCSSQRWNQIQAPAEPKGCTPASITTTTCPGFSTNAGSTRSTRASCGRGGTPRWLDMSNDLPPCTGGNSAPQTSQRCAPAPSSRPRISILAVTIFVGQNMCAKPLATATFCAPFAT
jgi:hypothetical protein